MNTTEQLEELDDGLKDVPIKGLHWNDRNWKIKDKKGLR